MKIPPSTVLATAVAAFLAVRSPSPQEEVAPFVSAGRSIYGISLNGAQDETLPELGPVEPVKVVGVKGHWALVEVRGQTRGPVWVNFDQVVSYRTDP